MAIEFQSALLKRSDEWLAQRRSRVILLLVLIAALARVIYFVQLSDGPCMQQYRWRQSDMYFFDFWASKIAAGDWIGDEPLHPHLPWMRNISQTAIDADPALKQLLETEAAAGSDKDLNHILWNRWLAGKTFHQEPLYPYMVAATYLVFGHDVRWVYAWQMLFGIGSVVLIYLIGRRYFGDTAGAISGIMAVLYAPLMYYELILLRDSFMVFISLAVIFTLDVAIEKKSVANWVAFGFASALALLLKSTFAPLIGACCVGVALTFRAERKEIAKAAGATAASLLLTLAPCIARNIYVGVSPMALSSPGMGALALIENNTSHYPDDSGTVFNLDYGPQIMASSGGKFFAAGIEVLKTHDGIGSVIKMVWHKFSFVWHWYEIPNNDNIYYYGIYAPILRWLPITFGIMAPVAIVGFFLGLWNLRRNWSLYLLLGSALVPLLISSILSRYRIPFAVTLIPFAGLAVARIVDWFAQKQMMAAAVSCASVVALMLIVNRPLAARETLMRTSDYGAPFTFYFRPNFDAAQKEKNWSGAQKLLKTALRAEPDFLKGQAQPNPAHAQFEAEVAGIFSWAHEKLALVLRLQNQPEAAVPEEKRAQELKQMSGKQ